MHGVNPAMFILKDNVHYTQKRRDGNSLSAHMAVRSLLKWKTPPHGKAAPSRPKGVTARCMLLHARCQPFG